MENDGNILVKYIKSNISIVSSSNYYYSNNFEHYIGFIDKIIFNLNICNILPERICIKINRYFIQNNKNSSIDISKLNKSIIEVYHENKCIKTTLYYDNWCIYIKLHILKSVIENNSLNIILIIKKLLLPTICNNNVLINNKFGYFYELPKKFC